MIYRGTARASRMERVRIVAEQRELLKKKQAESWERLKRAVSAKGAA